MKKISIIVPVYNEEKNLPHFFEVLTEALKKISYEWEVIFINDGSTDQSLTVLQEISQNETRVKTLDFSRNFGKEIALTAGINNAQGDACLMIDADLQHPMEKIPEFIERWEKGAEVVIGVRERNKGEGIIKKICSSLYYRIINNISEIKIVVRGTDFRLLDRVVVDEFNRLSERNRMTRALIDWLGFKREYVYFEANERFQGNASYSFIKLIRLAFNSMISLSLLPLKLAGYLGIIIMSISGILGIFIFSQKYIIKQMEFTWPAILAVIILFLIGIVLICLGFIALYIANIHTEVSNRPLYILRREKKENSAIVEE